VGRGEGDETRFGKHLMVTNKKKKTQRGVSHCGLAIYIKKYLKAKEELWKLNYFTMPK
jgi:hypothetical protein